MSPRAALAGLAVIVALAGCATPATPPPESAAGAAPAKPACEPEPFCYQACLRGYQPAYCRFHCGC